MTLFRRLFSVPFFSCPSPMRTYPLVLGDPLSGSGCVRAVPFRTVLNRGFFSEPHGSVPPPPKALPLLFSVLGDFFF